MDTGLNAKERRPANENIPSDKPPESITRVVAHEAANWLIRLSEDSSEHNVQACKQWQQAHPQHEQAWQRAVIIQEKMGLLPPAVGMCTLNRSVRADRRNALKSLALLVCALPVSYFAYRVSPLPAWSSDYHTGKGERRQLQLSDGSVLHLNTNTHVDVNFKEKQRFLLLHQGEILIETAKSSESLQALIVQTAQGTLQPIGTRFVVRKIEKQPETLLSVLEGAVKVRPLNDVASIQIDAGQQAVFTSTQIAPATGIDPNTEAWVKGLFYARNMRLDDFLKELSRYRYGILRCDPAVANLRISGAFQLDKPQQILETLPDTLAVSLQFISPYWVTVKARTP
ncbi:MAG: FecR domain-containing protein [Spongiibacteraceae bacterium]|nr:FecR domain-containing protein [Spongiibacteraceae bacterium]